MQEFNLLEDTAEIYKLVGPCLMKQPLAEAKDDVKKRIEYCKSGMYAAQCCLCLVTSLIVGCSKRLENTIKEKEAESTAKRQRVIELQRAFQQQQQQRQGK